MNAGVVSVEFAAGVALEVWALLIVPKILAWGRVWPLHEGGA